MPTVQTPSLRIAALGRPRFVRALRQPIFSSSWVVINSGSRLHPLSKRLEFADVEPIEMLIQSAQACTLDAK